MSAARRAAAIGAVGVLLLAGCAAAPDAAVVADEQHEAAQWAYADERWGELDEDYAACDGGALQSPVDIPGMRAAGAPSLEIRGGAVTGEVADTGHAMQFTVEDGSSTVVDGGTEYELVQLHAHGPAEHLLDGRAAAAELHLVHAAEDGALLVLGVLVEEGEASEAWAGFTEAAAQAEHDDEIDLRLDAASLLPGSLDFAAYEGSLTTPPCTEGVAWRVLTAPVTFSAEQVEQLTEQHRGNARGVRPLGDRQVLGGTAS